ncbi:MAG: hypothetical protein M1826_007412 [Phylliscum demangeonii]|nr:MAG: hypothetical protein M1826_007412 [Phylliscum demangeonii]
MLTATIAHTARPGVEPEDAAERKHHLKDGQGFTNPWESWQEMAAPKILWAMIRRRLSGTANSPVTTPPTVPVQTPQFLTERTGSDTLRATWLGHACYLVEFPGGLRVLFDPVFTPRCSPFSWLGPKRYTPMPCQIEDMPTIDAVVISHNHYDHLSHPTVTKIHELHPAAHFFVPLRNKKWFEDCGIHNVTELDWWEERELRLTRPASAEKEADVAALVSAPLLSASSSSSGGPGADIVARIGCLPCQHTSARTPFDRARTLWAGWSVESGGKRVYFAGDTGYRAIPVMLPKGTDDYGPEHQYPHCPAFKQIGDLRGPFDLGLIPIGAYDPRWIMSAMHADPTDSVNIFLDTKCAKALGMHWGTWVLTEEDVLEPPRLLKAALAKKALPEQGLFDVCDIGESRVFGS